MEYRMIPISYENVELKSSTPVTRYLDQKRSELHRAAWVLPKLFNQSKRRSKINHGVVHLVMVDGRPPYCKNVFSLETLYLRIRC